LYKFFAEKVYKAVVDKSLKIQWILVKTFIVFSPINIFIGGASVNFENFTFSAFFVMIFLSLDS